jgi:hypothetical protein
MKIDIKFRARHAGVPRCWVYGYFVVEKGCYYIVNDEGKFPVIAGTEGQFTTMLVRGDKELYQGDIIYYTPEENLQNPRDGTGTYLVVWDKTRLAWWLKNVLAGGHENERWDDFKQLLNNCFENRRIEIIGNMSENPELARGLVQ